MAISIQHWANYTVGRSKLVRRSENAVESDHVLKFLYDRECGYIGAVIQASMRDVSYKVKVSKWNHCASNIFVDCNSAFLTYVHSKE